MKKLLIFTLLSILLYVECGTIVQRRDAFDPEQLMEHHMDVRTNQGLFGSYHPNDLVQSIVDYFQHGVPQTLTGSEWGLTVYNPNEKMAQYMGSLVSPGNLGPQNENIMSTGNEGNSEHRETNSFNPDALNQRLMQNAFNKGSQFLNVAAPPASQVAAQSQVQSNLGFDPDALNNKLMQSVKNPNTGKDANVHDITTTNGVRVSQNVNRAGILGFNADTVNAQLLHSFNSPAVSHDDLETNGGMTKDQSSSLDFNPDALNAGLLSSVAYDPNAAAGGLTSFLNGAMSASGEHVHGIAMGTAASASNEHRENSQSQSSTGSVPAVDSGSGLQAQKGQTSGQDNAINSATAVTGTGQQMANFPGVSINGQTMAGSSFSVHQNGGELTSGPLSSSKESGSGFASGSQESNENGNLNFGLPSGIPDGGLLKQIDAPGVNVSGIGGMG